MTLTVEDLRGLPSPEGKLAEPVGLRKSIQKKLASVGILRIRSQRGARSKHEQISNDYAGHVARPQQVKVEVLKQPLHTLPKSQLLKPPLLADLLPTPKLPHPEEASIASVYDLSSFSPHASRQSIPSPAMQASLSSPEYNSEAFTSGEEFSNISSPVASLVLDSELPRRNVSRRKLRGAVVRPQIFELSSDDETSIYTRD